MKKIILKSELTIDRILEVIKDSDFVNDRVKFEDNVGKPTLQIKQKNNRIRMRCEMIGGPTKDNGFLEGTYFSGSIIIKCTSIGFSALLAIASLTGNPNDILGTNAPSMTSRWNMSAYLFTVSISFSRWRKSAASIEGAICIISVDYQSI